MQPTNSNSDSWPTFPYHVHNQADFDNPFINGRGFFTSAFQSWVSLFKDLQEFVTFVTRKCENKCLTPELATRSVGFYFF